MLFYPFDFMGKINKQSLKWGSHHKQKYTANSELSKLDFCKNSPYRD
jgi:hypothetical protein